MPSQHVLCNPRNGNKAKKDLFGNNIEYPTYVSVNWQADIKSLGDGPSDNFFSRYQGDNKIESMTSNEEKNWSPHL